MSVKKTREFMCCIYSVRFESKNNTAKIWVWLSDKQTAPLNVEPESNVQILPDFTVNLARLLYKY